MSERWQEKKSKFDGMLTVYGRKPVLEALQDNTLSLYRLHLADSNRSGGIIGEIMALAERRDIEIQWHSRLELSRISRNGKQDQGVAADIELPRYRSIDDLLALDSYQVIALDGVTNPQNLGMIIRSVAASPCTGLLLPKKGCAALSPLVIKASAGTLFKADIWFCDKIEGALNRLKSNGGLVSTLSSHATQSIYDLGSAKKRIFVLGNETEGVSKAVEAMSDQRIMIPMRNGVESLNVAITAALVAFAPGNNHSQN